jgi:hypothetical protein
MISLCVIILDVETPSTDGLETLHYPTPSWTYTHTYIQVCEKKLSAFIYVYMQLSASVA